jgi:hypothetical protein
MRASDKFRQFCLKILTFGHHALPINQITFEIEHNPDQLGLEVV